MKIKKKILSVFTAFLLAAGTVCALPGETFGTVASVSAADNVTEDGFKYLELEDGTLKITGYDGKAAEVTVPAKIMFFTITTMLRA